MSKVGRRRKDAERREMRRKGRKEKRNLASALRNVKRKKKGRKE